MNMSHHRITLILLLVSSISFAQKKPLDHSVYDGWQTIGERMVSPDGQWVVYTVTPQEGDADLFIQSADGSSYKKQVPRGYNAVITEDSRFVVFKIKPPYKYTREARIRKKKPEDLPKDSIGLVELGKNDVIKVAKVRSFKTPQKAAGWVAYLKEREPLAGRQATGPTQKTVDSLKRTIDSLVMLITEVKNVKGGNRDWLDAEDEPSGAAGANEGSELVLRKLGNGDQKVFRNVTDYYFSANGQKLMMKIARSSRDSFSANGVVLYDLIKGKADTLAKGGNDFKGFAFSEDGTKAAFVAERDTATKALQKFYQLYVYKNGDDSAQVLVDKATVGMRLGMTVSEHSNLTFSKSGNRLFFGTAPIAPPKDTSLIDIDLVKLDVWHYKDDQLQTQQLFSLNNELKRNYMAVYDFAANKVEQLGSKEFPTVIPTAEGDGTFFIAQTDTGRRVARQWGESKVDVYSVNVLTGEKKLVKRNHQGTVYPSSTGKYILLYDEKTKHYAVWNGKGLKVITSAIKVPLYNEEHDTPGDPNPYGLMGWHQGDSFVYVYDRFDVWKLDPEGKKEPRKFTSGRTARVQYRYLKLDPEERFFTADQVFYFRGFNQQDKNSFIARMDAAKPASIQYITPNEAVAYDLFLKAKTKDAYLFSKETYMASPDLYVSNGKSAPVKFSSLNPQQATYNWGTAELYHWTAFNGKAATGVLYKPEDFDAAKKYPMIIYFYEKVSDNLHNYIDPAPTPSRLNIPFFVSRGYLVFTPDISYTRGHPAKDAYNYIVSGAQALAKKKWVDAKNIGIQGQSWGGYQVLALITQTGMFKAAWAGAPVVNMFSAYGGIRWESGVNRQMQYEKGQSRIGYTVWQKPELYIENSPLFHLPKVTTPLVIMANDADGAVPWYQGIELFTAMRRLNKPVWMLNYNGEAHNLVERKNRKDIQIREQQYFDWLLKGEKPARWITEGVPAVKKGKAWGLEIVD
jgi:dipeptidyl aminopeptidase/acylaminoacyl peptidase